MLFVNEKTPRRILEGSLKLLDVASLTSRRRDEKSQSKWRALNETNNNDNTTTNNSINNSNNHNDNNTPISNGY